MKISVMQIPTAKHLHNHSFVILSTTDSMICLQLQMNRIPPLSRLSSLATILPILLPTPMSSLLRQRNSSLPTVSSAAQLMPSEMHSLSSMRQSTKDIGLIGRLCACHEKGQIKDFWFKEAKERHKTLNAIMLPHSFLPSMTAEKLINAVDKMKRSIHDWDKQPTKGQRKSHPSSQIRKLVLCWGFLQIFSPILMEASSDYERLQFGKMGYGCKHYRRRCKIRAPCCNEVFSCRHCHNEATSMLSKPFDRHDIVRQDVKQVICAVCDTEQPVAQVCTNCGVNMGEYFCDICKFYDDDIEKEQFHCDECGICRVGGQENYFHCEKCGSCYAIALRDNHMCVENSMRHHCPICYEYLFDSLKGTIVMKCGHTMHSDCYDEMMKRDKYCCPICSKSVVDMSKIWKRMDEEIEATVMPDEYRNKKVWILCNDCNDTTEANFHILGQKCSHCKSYNTRTIAPPVLPQ